MEISVLGVFLVNLLYTLRKKHNALPLKLMRGISDGGSNDETSSSTPKSSSPTNKKGTGHIQHLSKEDMETALRQLVVTNMAPEVYYQISSNNLYDFELPPGIVTMNEVKLVIELYRKGGKLVPRSVHKLLRLGYKILKERANVTKVNIAEGDKLVVVGDLHGNSVIFDSFPRKN